MNSKQKKQLKSWGIDPKTIKDKKRIPIIVFFVLLVIGIMITFWALTLEYRDTICAPEINQSFINGTTFGLEYAIASITSEAIQCNQIPINYQGYNYTLIAMECLNLTGQNIYTYTELNLREEN